MLRDANVDGQFPQQCPGAPVTGGCGGLYHGAVSDLAPRPGPLAVVVQVQSPLSEQLALRRQRPDEVDHGAVAACIRRAERQIQDRTQMVLELAGGGALDGPVPGVVHARRHLVGNQFARTHEELDGENPTVAKVPEHAPEITCGSALPLGASEGCAGKPQDSLTVHVATERVYHDVTTDTARADDRHLAIETDPFFVNEGHVPQSAKSALRLCSTADQRLPLAVVAKASRLDDTRKADPHERSLELGERADRVPARRGDRELLEELLLCDPILSGGESRKRWRDARASQPGDPREALDRDIFPVERDHFAAARKPAKQCGVAEAAVQQRRHAARGSVARRIETEEVESQRVASQCEHAAELAGADDADGHERGGARGSGLPRTPAVWRSRNDSSAVAMAGWRLARIAAAQSAALVAPAGPMANVATGTPAGICTIESRESSPPRDLDC